MNWYIREPFWLHSELSELKTNSNYVEISTNLDRCLVSSGYIITRLEKVERHPILFVYPDATPYEPPSVFLLQEIPKKEEIQRLSKMQPWQIAANIRKYAKFYSLRHQYPSGSLCILDADDLHSERPEIVEIRAVISRVRDWLAGVQTGRLPKDSREVELFSHFPKTTSEVEFLLPDEFFDSDMTKGSFYLATSRYLPSDPKLPPVFYFGLGILGTTQSGIMRSSLYKPQGNVIFAQSILDPVEIVGQPEVLKIAIDKGELIEGQWWDIAQEPQPFSTIAELADLIGDGDGDIGFSELATACSKAIAENHKYTYIGLRFPGRRQEKDWQMFRLVRAKSNAALLFKPTEEEIKSRLTGREVEAIRSEYVTESYFHLRNSGRCERQKLAQQKVTCIGLGALGSTIADLIAKGGVGHMCLVDKGSIQAHNVIRHTMGLNHLGMKKALAVASGISVHNPFVSVIPIPASITLSGISNYFPADTIGISTLADDNIEAFLNDQAVRENRVVFYARSLRGGKAARIFRVQPGIDACKECLALYHKEKLPPFVSIEEDKSLPVLTNECNNPVRPGSGADMGIIGSIAARLVLDYLQGIYTDMNHWVWATEPLDGIDYSINTPYALHSYSLKPHPKCRLCQRLSPKDVLIARDAYEFMKNEGSRSGDIETGGILMGFRSGTGNLIITKVSGPGPSSIRRSDWFERDRDFCQQVLDKTVAELGERGQYVGEWHYHPRDTNQPSGRDLQSLTEIALQANYATDEPVLVILSPDLEFAFTIHPASKSYVSTDFKITSSEETRVIKPTNTPMPE